MLLLPSSSIAASLPSFCYLSKTLARTHPHVPATGSRIRELTSTPTLHLANTQSSVALPSHALLVQSWPIPWRFYTQCNQTVTDRANRNSSALRHMQPSAEPEVNYAASFAQSESEIPPHDVLADFTASFRAVILPSTIHRWEHNDIGAR